MRDEPTMILCALAAVALAACSESSPSSLDGSGSPGNAAAGTGAGAGGGTAEPEHTVLDDRKLDYFEALRTASLKLVRTVPTLQQIKDLQRAKNKRAAYEAELDKMFADVRFQERMIKYWKDVMRMAGGAKDDGSPSRDTAPIFAARTLVEGRPFDEVFTAAANNCPGYDYDAHAFVDGECNNAAPAQAGVLTNPGVMYQFYGNMGFRRVRWIQEVFVCTKFPAEYAATPIQKNGADYVSPWPFESVATAPIDFQDTKSVICANCHTTINHIAPLVGNFDKQGMWHDTIQVVTPQTPDPIPTELSHWLKEGEVTSWRLGKPAADLPALGDLMAQDPDVAECAVTRAWNLAMSKEDVVSDLATVPTEVLEDYRKEYEANGHDMKAVLRSMFASDDFVRF